MESLALRWNRLDEAISMNGHNIRFGEERWKLSFEMCTEQ